MAGDRDFCPFIRNDWGLGTDYGSRCWFEFVDAKVLEIWSDF